MAKKLTGFCVSVEDHPGVVASIAGTLGKQGINIDGCTAVSFDGTGVVYFVTNNTEATTTALNKAGIKYTTKEFFEVSVQDKPDELTKITKPLADAKINITALFITTRKSVVIEVDQTAKATTILQK